MNSTTRWCSTSAAISQSLGRRGYLTTEWWTTVLGGVVSAVLAFVDVGGSTGAQVAAVAAPALLAAIYAVLRTFHKTALAPLLEDLFPQASTGPPPGGQSGQNTP